MEFSVFTRTQNPAADPAPHRGTRTIVSLVLQAGLAIRVGQNAIRLTTDSPWREVKLAARTGGWIVAKSSYIPDKMPPREVPGCWYQLPQSPTWREQHRRVSFLEAQECGTVITITPVVSGSLSFTTPIAGSTT